MGGAPWTVTVSRSKLTASVCGHIYATVTDRDVVQAANEMMEAGRLDRAVYGGRFAELNEAFRTGPAMDSLDVVWAAGAKPKQGANRHPPARKPRHKDRRPANQEELADKKPVDVADKAPSGGTELVEAIRRNELAHQRWSAVRGSDEMRRANAATLLARLVEAISCNDARLSQAQLELQGAREQLEALDVKVLEQLSNERLQVMLAIEVTRQAAAKAGEPMPTAKQLHEELTGPTWQMQTTLAAIKKATSVLGAMAKAGMAVSQDVFINLLKEKAAAEVV